MLPWRIPKYMYFVETPHDLWLAGRTNPHRYFKLFPTWTCWKQMPVTISVCFVLNILDKYPQIWSIWALKTIKIHDNRNFLINVQVNWAILPEKCDTAFVLIATHNYNSSPSIKLICHSNALHTSSCMVSGTSWNQPARFEKPSRSSHLAQ